MEAEVLKSIFTVCEVKLTPLLVNWWEESVYASDDVSKKDQAKKELQSDRIWKNSLSEWWKNQLPGHAVKYASHC